MQFRTDEEIERLLIEAGALEDGASRQVRRRAIKSAREKLGDRDLDLEQAKRLFGWKSASEMAKQRKSARGAMQALFALASLSVGSQRG